MVTIPSSYADIPKDDALKLTNDLCQIFFEAGLKFDVVTLHKVGKQFISLYFDSKTSRYDLSEYLIELQFIEFAVKVMKQLNNFGVFKGDDVWFATFYLYNICWNYSEVNPAFASGLIRSGIEHLLISNITHDPYIDNLSKRNVNYLIKATLSISYNILRVPGNRMYLSSDNIIKGLLKIASKDDKLSVLCTMCLSYIACNDNIEPTTDFDIFYNVKLLFYYIKVASESSGKYNSYHLFEFFEVLKFGSFSKIQRDAIIKLDGFDVMIEQLKTSKEDRLKKEILLAFANLLDDKYKPKLKEIANYYMPNKSPIISSAAKTLSWAIEINDNANANGNAFNGKKNIFINFGQRDYEMASKIFERLADLQTLPLSSYEDDIDALRNSYDDAAVIIVCVSEAFRGTIPFKIGSEYCLRKNKVIFPVLVQSNYKPDGWIKDFVSQASDVFFDFANDMDSTWGAFRASLNCQLDSLVHVEVSEEVPVLLAIEKPADIYHWLAEHNLTELNSKLANINMDMLHYLKRIRSEAPDFYFRSLEKSLKLSFVEVLKLSAAMDRLG